MKSITCYSRKTWRRITKNANKCALKRTNRTNHMRTHQGQYIDQIFHEQEAKRQSIEINPNNFQTLRTCSILSRSKMYQFIQNTKSQWHFISIDFFMNISNQTASFLCKSLRWILTLNSFTWYPKAEINFHFDFKTLATLKINPERIQLQFFNF